MGDDDDEPRNMWLGFDHLHFLSLLQPGPVPTAHFFSRPLGPTRPSLLGLTTNRGLVMISLSHLRGEREALLNPNTCGDSHPAYIRMRT